MKTLLLTVSAFICFQANGQIVKETTNESHPATKVLYVSNINGGIEVEAYDGSEITIEAVRTLMSKSDKKLENAKREMKVKTISLTDTLIVYIGGIGECFCREDVGKSWRSSSGYRYQYGRWNDDVEFNFDFTIKVPANIDLVVSTVNNGDIVVKGTKGNVEANNVNGEIELLGMVGYVTAHTINGDVTIDFDQIPATTSRFYSLNGDIKANFKQILNAEIDFKSYNGDLFTNITDLTQLPSRIEKSEHSGKGVTYKIGEFSAFQIRNGGVKMNFETFNGDVYVKEI